MTVFYLAFYLVLAELDIFVAGNTERQAYNNWFDFAEDNTPLLGDLTVPGVNLFRISNTSLLIDYENGTVPSFPRLRNPLQIPSLVCSFSWKLHNLSGRKRSLNRHQLRRQVRRCDAWVAWQQQW